MMWVLYVAGMAKFRFFGETIDGHAAAAKACMEMAAKVAEVFGDHAAACVLNVAI